MKKLITVVGFSLTTFFAAAEVVVVVHPANQNTLDATSISRIYLGKAKSFPNGNQVVPVTQTDSSEVTLEFNKKVLKKSQSQIKAYWSKLLFTGKGTPPQIADDDASVIKLVANNPNIIGFVRPDAVTSDVKVVAKF